jgi:hypothetical protein
MWSMADVIDIFESVRPGTWPDVRAGPPSPAVDQTCLHGERAEDVITWALRGWNPFEKDPLK